MPLSILKSPGNCMNSIETDALLLLKSEFIHSVDPMTVVSILFKNGYVDESLYNNVHLLFRKGNNRVEILNYMIERIPCQVSFAALVTTLDKCGYYKLAARLFLAAFTSNQHYRIHNSEAGSRMKLQSFFRNLKHMVHDSQFKNPRYALRTMAKRYKVEFDKEIDEQERQRLADRCITILGAEIDAHYDSLACKLEITQEEMLAEMKTLIPHSSNPLIMDTIYYTRQANMKAFQGKHQQAEHMLIQARSCAFNIEHCLELVNMLYTEIYVKLWEFKVNPSASILDSIMMWGRIGLESLEAETESTKSMWRRMFILRMVFAMLGIGNRANVIPLYSVDRTNLVEAQRLLAIIDTNWNGIEVRREMFYCVARARLNEQLRLFEEAKCYIARAKHLAVQGRFLEKIPFIEEFRQVLDDKLALSNTYFTDDDRDSTRALPERTVAKHMVDNDQTELKLHFEPKSHILQNQYSCATVHHVTLYGRNALDSETNEMSLNQTCVKCYQSDSEFQLSNLKSFGESDLIQNVNINNPTTEAFYQSHHYTNCEISMQTLKTCSDSSNSQIGLACTECSLYSDSNEPKRSKDQTTGIIDITRTYEETDQQSELYLKELKEPGVCSVKLPSDLEKHGEYTFDNNENTVLLKTHPKVLDKIVHLPPIVQTDRRVEIENIRDKLLGQSPNSATFGSIALYESRGEAEGASNDFILQVNSTDNEQELDLHLVETRYQNTYQLDNDIDDEALFGDGTGFS